jgi:ABC-2 type transport system ATP-binding protein
MQLHSTREADTSAPAERAAGPAIETRGLRKRFGALEAVQGLDLTVPRGGVYGFLGLNGAGKTTTIRMLLGLLRPTGGELRVLGGEMPGQRLRILGRIGALVETPTTYRHLTGRENLEATRRLIGAEPARVPEALGVVGLAGAANRLVREYSTGMRQRLGLALALLGTPELLVLDEPMNGLDPGGIQEVRELIRELPARFGVTVFLSSHLLSEVEHMATHVGIIHGGRLKAQGSIDSILAAERRLRVVVTEPESAADLLRRAGWEVIAAAGTLLVQADDDSAAMAVNRTLVEGGFGVSRLQFEEASLEHVFFASTGSKPEAA